MHTKNNYKMESSSLIVINELIRFYLYYLFRGNYHYKMNLSYILQLFDYFYNKTAFSR